MKTAIKKLTAIVCILTLTVIGAITNVVKAAPSVAKEIALRVSVWALGILGIGHFLASSAHAQSSAYVTQMEDAADQMVVDLGAVLPIALGVAVVSVGVFIVWSIFKRLARG